MAIHYKDEEQMQTLITEEFGEWSQPFKIEQKLISDFAEMTGDDMWMHVDEARCAKESPYGCTIAHGFLILACLPKMPGKKSLIADIEGYGHMMNYGSDRLRFSGAVPVNSEIHSRSRVKAVQVTEKNTRLTLEQHVNIVGEERPALIYELTMVFI
jgi:acyl dehydratase